MVTVNIDGKYSISGSNKGVLFGNSNDVKPVGPPMANGFEFHEMDTRKTYLYDESGQTWRYWKTEGDGGGGGDVPIATDAEVDEALYDLFEGHH